MAAERAALTGEEQPVPKGYRWAKISAPQMEGVELEQHYRETLRELGQQRGMLGLIFEKAQTASAGCPGSGRCRGSSGGRSSCSPRGCC